GAIARSLLYGHLHQCGWCVAGGRLAGSIGILMGLLLQRLGGNINRGRPPRPEGRGFHAPGWLRCGPAGATSFPPRPEGRGFSEDLDDEVWALHRQGWSTAAIATQVGCSRRTIERSLQMPTWPVPQHRRHYGRSVL